MRENALTHLFRRYRDQFEEGVDIAMIDAPNGKPGTPRVRVYSPRAALRVVRHARTPEADRMFELLLDYVEAKQRRMAALPAPRSDRAQLVLDLIGSDAELVAHAADIRSGRIALANGAELQPLLLEAAEADRHIAIATRTYRSVNARAEAIGYRPGEVKLIRDTLKGAA